ncbi:TetR family transcriptional regulator [Actinotalea sp. M2MS4P-6]|uniref:acyl-CoA-like ligand-binding transcription factor n=1 Tax=Actinotalea sp. M2MS4P-6 TaxID=2983762 RepID=UPI0021E4E2E5|nr:TetR family transcriptional regulator [Actinotalea sp. M2MS4P-6]MCV2393302.1 TetR family transcriptional regulator [Actinotalea sp. M2MS4P-6]
MDATESLRDRKKLRTREQLVAAATELFAERGYDAVTVGEIAERAWVSERTFFRYFGAKEDVLWPDSGEQLALFAATIEARPAVEHPLESVRNAMIELGRALGMDATAALTRARIVAATPSLVARDMLEYSRWEGAVRDAVRRRTGADERDLAPEMTAVVAGGALRVSFERWVADGARGDLAEMIGGAFAAVEGAIRD